MEVLEEERESKEVAIVTKEWQNTTAAGLAALAVSCFGFFALLSGRVETSAMPLLGCWLIGGFIIQLITGLLDLKGGNHAGGNVFLFFSAFFMLVGGIEMFIKYNAIKAGTPLDTRLDGYVWIALTLILYVWTPAFLKTFNPLSLIVLGLDIALPFITLVDLKVVPGGFSHVAAWALLFCAVDAIYLCGATVINIAYGKKIIPIFDINWKKS